MIEEDEGFKSADKMDSATRVERMETEGNVRRARGLSKPEQVQNEDGSWPITECVTCEDDIPAARLELGKIRCVICQGKIENAAKRK